MACGKSNAPVSGVVAWLLLVLAALLILPIVVQVEEVTLRNLSGT